jgi:hypothetical protein
LLKRRRLRVNLVELVRVRELQRIQEHAVHYGKNRSVCANTEGEGENGHSSEAGVLAQHARPEAQILYQGFKVVHTPRVAALLFRALDSTKLQPCPAQRFGARHAAADQIVGAGLDMETKFRIHVAFRSRAPENCA